MCDDFCLLAKQLRDIGKAIDTFTPRYSLKRRPYKDRAFCALLAYVVERTKVYHEGAVFAHLEKAGISEWSNSDSIRRWHEHRSHRVMIKECQAFLSEWINMWGLENLL